MSVARVIIDSAGSGSHNMAVDEVLLRQAASTDQVTLRFYSWSEPTLSLGYFQRFADRANHANSQNAACVRRASGGGAILHHHELTYSIAVPVQDRFANSDLLYLAFHETLVKTLAATGIQTRLADADDVQHVGNAAFLCFQRRSVGDIVCGDSKITGSAQRRWRQALTQHGSILLKASPFAPELCGISDLIDCEIEVADLIAGWLPNLQTRLEMEFEASELGASELAEASALRQSKFGRSEWTKRR
ncbi:MAG: hypothetical protein R3C28_16925 [Pirellulaceae bacterium]